MSRDLAGLTVEQRAVLDFERGWWLDRSRRTKQEAIRDALRISPTRYYAQLESLVDSPDALAYDPLLVRRLRRRREQRRRALFSPGTDRPGQRRR